MEKKQNRRLKEEENGRLHRFGVLVAWFTEYLTTGGYRKRTVSDYVPELFSFSRWLCDNTDIDDIDDITGEILGDYTASLYSRTLSSATINRKIAVLRSFFGALHRENKLYADLRQYLHAPKISRPLPKALLSEAEMAGVFSYLERNTSFTTVKSRAEALQLRDHALFEVAYGTGMRRCELMALTPDDINYDDGVIFIRDGKGGKQRMVPIGETGMRVVHRYATEGRPLLKPRTPALFVSMRGKAIDHYSILVIIQRILRNAGINKNVTLHSIRHCCATHMLNRGADIRYVQEMLGHASLNTTQVYTHVSIQRLRRTHAKHHPREQGDF